MSLGRSSDRTPAVSSDNPRHGVHWWLPRCVASRRCGSLEVLLSVDPAPHILQQYITSSGHDLGTTLAQSLEAWKLTQN